MADEKNSFYNGGTGFMNNYHTEDRQSDYSEVVKSIEREHLSTAQTVTTYVQGRKSSYVKNTSGNFGYKTVDVDKIPERLSVSETEANDMMGKDIFTPVDSMVNNRFNKFSRYGYLDPTGELVTGTREYLFFSRPDLHLVDTDDPSKQYEALSSSPFFDEAFNRYKQSYYALQQTFSLQTSEYVTSDGIPLDLNCRYIPLLSNMVTSTLDLSDITAGEVQNNQNLYQINTSYREGSIVSDCQYDFSLEFKDTKYLDVYMLFKIYDEYFRIKYEASSESPIYPTKLSYIFNKIYPEAISIWKVIVDDTGRIMYWAKAIGCTPMSVPRSTISNIEGNIKFTVSWKAQFIREMDPVNLRELNYLTARSFSNDESKEKLSSLITPALNKIYESDKDGVRAANMNGSTWVGYPYVMIGGSSETGQIYRSGHTPDDVSKNAGTSFHRLIWLDKK